MMIKTLIKNAHFDAAKPLWRDGIAEPLFESFFACLLVQMASNDGLLWYSKFVKATKAMAQPLLSDGSPQDSSNALPFSSVQGFDGFWGETQRIIKAQLAKWYFVDDELLKIVLPLATHKAFDILTRLAHQKQVSVQALILTHLADILPKLPAWAEQVIDENTLARIDVERQLLGAIDGEYRNEPSFGVLMGADNELKADKRYNTPANTPNGTATQAPKDRTPSQHAITLNNSDLNSGDLNNSDFNPTGLHQPLNQSRQQQPSPSQNQRPNTPSINGIGGNNKLNKSTNHRLSATNLTANNLTATHSSGIDDNDIDGSGIDNSGIGNSGIDTAQATTPQNVPPKQAMASNPTAQHTKNPSNQPLNTAVYPKATPKTTPPKAINIPTPPPKRHSGGLGAGLLGGLVLVLLLATAMGAWYYFKHQNAGQSVVQSGATPQSLPASFLSISVGQAGELYACHAEFASREQSERLFGILQNNFNNPACVIDVNDAIDSSDVNANMAGFDALTSVIGLLKTAPYATLELHGNELFVNAPNADDVARLIKDIRALMPAMTVEAMPNNTAEIQSQSIDKARLALQALDDNANDYALAKAASIQHIDTKAGLSDDNKAILALVGKKIATRPNARFIVAVHSDDTGDTMMARQHTQNLADTIKATLMAQGVADSQLVAQGVGFNFPLSDNQTNIGRFKNRRVEILPYDEAILAALIQSGGSQNSDTAYNDATYTPTYVVVDGQIVEQGSAQEQALLSQLNNDNNATGAENSGYNNDNYNNNYSSSYSGNNYSGNNYNNAPENAYGGGYSGNDYGGYDNSPPQTPQRPDIPEDLLTPIGSDPAGGGIATPVH